MVRQQVKKAPELRRKEFVPDDLRTTERDKAADWLEEHIIAEGRWSETTIQDIAAESDWSRQHIANTLDSYFEPADSPAAFDDTEKPLGYRQGFRDGISFVQENPEMFGLRRE